MQDNEEGSGNETGGGKITEGDPKGEDKNAWLLHAVPELPGPGVQVGSGWAWGSYRRGFSKRVAVLTRLSCVSRFLVAVKGLTARSDGERSRGASRLQVWSGQYFTVMLFDN